MNANRWITVLVLAAAVLPARIEAAAAAKLRQIVPPDALFYAGVDNVGQLRATWDKTSMARFWKDPVTQQFTAPMRKEISEKWRELKESHNVTEEWHAYLPGEVVFYGERIRRLGEEGYEIPLCFAAKTGLPRERYLALINKYIATLPPDARKREYTAQDVTVRVVEYRREMPAAAPEAFLPPEENAAPPAAAAPKTVPAYFQHAFIDDVLLLSDGDEAVMRGMIRRLKSPPGETVNDVQTLKRVRTLLPADGHVTAYLAVNQLFERLLEEAKVGAGAQPGMFNPAALGLDQFRGVGLGIHLSPERFTVSMALDLPQEGTGVAAILRKLRPSPLATLAVTPASVLTYSSMAVDWAGLWNEGRALIRAVAPPADLTVTIAVQAWENNLGMKIADVLGAVGEEIAYFLSVPPGPSGASRYTFLFGVKDRRRLDEAVNALLTFAQGRAQVDATDFLGHTIRTLRPVAPPDEPPDETGEEDGFRISWVVTNDLLAISRSLDSVKQVLQFKAGSRKDTLATTALYRDARALLPKQIDSFEVVEAGGFIESFLGDLLKAGKQISEMRTQFGAPDMPFDFNAPFTAATAKRYFGMIASGMQIDANGFAWVTVSQLPPAK